MIDAQSLSPPPSRRELTWRRKLAYSVLTTLLFCGAIEGLARLATSHSDGIVRFQQMQQVSVFLGRLPSDAVFEPDAERFWRLKRNVELPGDRGLWWSGRWSNSLGYRNEDFALERPADVLRIACFGDSTTFGLGSSMSESWPSLLQKQLRRRTGLEQLEVINAGVPGYSSHQGLHALRQDLPRLKPDIVVATFGTNDSWNWDNHSDAELAENVVDKLLDRVAGHSRFVQTIKSLVQRRQSAALKANWAETATANFFAPETTWRPRVEPTQFAANLRHLASLCRQQECRLVLLVWPDRQQVEGATSRREPWLREIRTVASEEQIKCIDLVPVFCDLAPGSLKLFGDNDSIHVTSAGNQLVCDTIFESLKL